jgi:superfamily II DNA or RNA helicase
VAEAELPVSLKIALYSVAKVDCSITSSAARRMEPREARVGRVGEGLSLSTAYHSKFFAHELMRQCSSRDSDKLNRSILNATVDLNPHQIDAALFAFRSPLSRGAILADEVGLGKTIEAGLIVSQLWAERKRRILCILPAGLREQWHGEMREKFFIDSVILETKNFNQFVKGGVTNPFEQSERLVLCSYPFARAKAAEIRAVCWDLVLVDEAHRLRNVYKKNNKIAQTIRDAIDGRPKVLLTATPLQNSLMELFGLTTFIDPLLFGSEESFREQFLRGGGDGGSDSLGDLRTRLSSICQRTLRRQVAEYIKYTNRVSFTQDFTPTAQEVRLYDAVSVYLQRADLFAIPSAQRALITLVLRKILASSSFAIASTLGKMVDRLEALHTGKKLAEGGPTEGIAEDFELTDELRDEWSGDEPDGDNEEHEGEPGPEDVIKLLRREIDELQSYRGLAESITSNAKGDALLAALNIGFEQTAKLGGKRKALIFTESRRTQAYLKELLEAQGYAGQVVTLNGTNTDPRSVAIHRDWVKRHAGDECVKGSKSVDVRSALVEEFRDRSAIMVATESGAEGLNLQFCSLVVNYDLPWNPQRIEQRIGRCHRYGQEHDVVVINFLNRRNEADRRVFELLSEKLRLFDGVFGASDEILGVLESGVDFEKRINEIYQTCRSPGEINAAFDQLQLQLDEQIQARMKDTRAKLLEHFDEEVHERLRVSRDETIRQLDRFERWLLRLTRFELGDCAQFEESDGAFDLLRMPEGIDGEGISLGRYRLVTRKNGTIEHHYRLGHPLAERLIERARSRILPVREVVFHYVHPPRIALVENLVGKSGWLRTSLLSIESLEREEQLIFTGLADDGTLVDADTFAKLFQVEATVSAEMLIPDHANVDFARHLEQSRTKAVSASAERNREYFDDESEKLETWAEDLKEQLEAELKELDREIKATKKEARQCSDLESKVELRKKAQTLERKRGDKRRSLFDAQDEVDAKKEILIAEIERRLTQKVELVELFTIRWSVI